MSTIQKCECSNCGGSTVEMACDDLIRATKDSMYDGADPASPEFIRLTLHIIGSQLYGTPKFACCDCGELMSFRARSYGCRQIATDVVTKEVNQPTESED